MLSLPYIGCFVSDVVINNVVVKNIAVFVLKVSTGNNDISGIIETSALEEVSSLQRRLRLHPAAENRVEDEVLDHKAAWIISDEKTHMPAQCMQVVRV